MSHQILVILAFIYIVGFIASFIYLCVFDLARGDKIDDTDLGMIWITSFFWFFVGPALLLMYLVDSIPRALANLSRRKGWAAPSKKAQKKEK